MDEDIPKKACSRCLQVLPLTTFYLRKKGAEARIAQCKKCFMAARNRERAKVARKAWRKRVAERKGISAERASTKAWKQRNPDRHQAANKRWLVKNYQRNVELKKKFRQSPKGRMAKKIARLRRRALKRQALGTFTMQQFYGRCEYYGWCCYLCHKSLTPQTVVIEHRIPLCRNGTNWPANLAPSCNLCNSRKHHKTEIEYRLQLALETGS